METIIIKERPILFSGSMVRAILEGRKTQTRRIVKFSDPFKVGQPHEHRIMKMAYQMNDGNWGFVDGVMNPVPMRLLVGDGKKCPYGQPGDRLWVRETFVLENGGGEYEVKEPTDGTPCKKVMCSDGEGGEQETIEVPHYRATEPDAEIWPWDCLNGDCDHDDYDYQCGCVWKPSIHMPRWASRINLEVVKVRVEKLQDISWQDARDEGIQMEEVGTIGLTYCHPTDEGRHTQEDELAYQWLWESINGPKSWDLNPWVWVVEFKKV